MPAPRNSEEWFSERLPTSVIPPVPFRFPRVPSEDSMILNRMDSFEDIDLNDDQDTATVEQHGQTGDRQSLVVVVELTDDGSFDVHLGPRKPMLTRGGLKTDPSLTFIPGTTPKTPSRWRKFHDHVGSLVASGAKAATDVLNNVRPPRPTRPTKPVELRVLAVPSHRQAGSNEHSYRSQPARNKRKRPRLNLNKPLPPLPALETFPPLTVPPKAESEPVRVRKPVFISKPATFVSHKGSISDFATSPAASALATPRKAPRTPCTLRWGFRNQALDTSPMQPKSSMDWD